MDATLGRLKASDKVVGTIVATGALVAAALILQEFIASMANDPPCEMPDCVNGFIDDAGTPCLVCGDEGLWV